MSKKKRKLSRVQLVKEKARAVIGAPKPTSVRSSRPRSTAGANALDPFLNRKDVSANPHYQPREEFVDGAPRLSTVEGLHIKNPVLLKTPRQKPQPPSKGVQYSPEVIQHLNILRAQDGEPAVQNYLKNLRDRSQNNMGSTDIAERLTREHDSPVPVHGSIEIAMHDAELKVAFYDGEVKRCTAERERWTKIVDNLKQVLQLTSGEFKPEKPAGNPRAIAQMNRKPRGYWEDIVSKALPEGKPLRRVELYEAVRKHIPADDVTKMYPAMANLIEKGYLLEVDGKVALASWTNPAK